MDFCADKIELKDRIEALEDELNESKESIDHLNEKIELIQKNSERLERDRSRLEVENSRLRAMLDDVRAGKSFREEVPATNKAEPEIVAPVGDVYVASEPEQREDDASDDGTKNQTKKTANRNRVGSMFDLLTFTDV